VIEDVKEEFTENVPVKVKAFKDTSKIIIPSS
jgi:hypothetical protein